MSTTIRPELSAKNKYWINKHRYYELKHFCLQYPEWKRAYLSLDGYSRQPTDPVLIARLNGCGDPTSRCAIERIYYADRMKVVEQSAIDTDSELAGYILKGVTEGISYEHLKARLDIPCCKDTYYDLYRRFFWILNRTRD